MRKRSSNLAIGVFIAIWALIGSIETFDIYCSIKLQETLSIYEKNPIGKFLIQLDDGDVALFMTMKAATMMMLLGIIPVIYALGRKITAWIMMFVILISRFLVFGYLIYN